MSAFGYSCIAVVVEGSVGIVDIQVGNERSDSRISRIASIKVGRL